jgi:hypothetical protein
MATGRTVSANFVTEKDQQVISLCGQIAEILVKAIPDKKTIKEFLNEFAKISNTRDGGAGRGAGKLQRDALCTRGRGGKAPFSNRNLRWHPLVVAESSIESAKEIDAIEIEGEDESQTLIFIVNGRRYPSEKVHELPQRYAALPKHWFPHIDKLKYWSDTLWTQNSCVIPALESCNWEDAVETYAVLGIAIAVEIYKANFDSVFKNITTLLTSQQIDERVKLPSKDFPSDKKDIISCPMCKAVISQNAANIPDRIRIPVWQPAWRSTKREEGEDSSIQIMHMIPLIDRTMNHNAKNVRYGHRWCNVSMTDHSLDETLDFMEYIVKAHNRCK